jgi:maltooligosyltrehalose trehalohydrolase
MSGTSVNQEQRTPPPRGDARRLLPVGADVQPGGGVHFRVWAPRRERVEVVIDPDANGQGKVVVLAAEPDGYFGGGDADAGAGTRYAYRLDGSARLYADPASRFQPYGPHGPSEVIDPSTYQWNEGAWAGVKAEGQVIYEMHVGTFTP